MGGYWGTKAEGESDDDTTGEGEREDEKTTGGATEQDKKPGETTVDATLCFTFATDDKPQNQAQQEYLAEVDRLGYKIGLRVRADQAIHSFRFRRDGGDVELDVHTDVTQDLDQTFGTPAGEKWLGFRPRSRVRRKYVFPEPNVICYEMVLTLSPRPRLPLLIPIVIRRDNRSSFSDSCIGGLLVIRARRARRS